jgi:hypothetical protein
MFALVRFNKLHAILEPEKMFAHDWSQEELKET